MKKYWNILLAMSRATLLSIIAVAVLAGLMLFKLSSLTPGLSEIEMSTYESSLSLSVIGENLVNAPYKVAVLLSTKLFDSAFGLRLVGALFGGLSIILYYLLARKLFGSLVAVASSALFASSSLLLHNARLATPNIMLLSLLALIAVGFYLRFGKRKDIGWLLTAITAGLALYTPGMIFFVIIAVLWQFRHARKSFENLKTPTIAVISVIFALICVPLIISLVRDPNLWRSYLGLPVVFEPVTVMLKYAGTVVLSLFALSPRDPVHWLGRQPILDVFTITMFAYGSYQLVKQYRLDRLWTFLGVFIVATLWIGITANRHAIIILLPFVYLIVGIGIQKFINKWLSVFPNNPIARSTGSVLLLILILLSINFQVYRYFVAWSNNDDTKAAFQLQLPE